MSTDETEVLSALLRIGALEIPDRIVTAPLARARSIDRPGSERHVGPHGLSVLKIANRVADFAAATVRTHDAGCDGVEIQRANGV